MSVETISAMTEMLVPLDGREASLRAVPAAARIANRLALVVKLFGVSDDPAITTAWLRAQADRLLPGVDVSVAARSGDPAEVIVQEAGPDTLVAMATAATLLPHQGHVGSVAEAVVRGVGRPALLIGPHVNLDPGKPIDRVVVPVDGSKLSEQALDVAGDLAKTLDVPVWVVSVISAKAEASAGQRLGTAPFTRESGYIRGLAEQLAHDYGIRTGFDVLHIPHPAEAILDFAGSDGAVVMTTHGRSGLSRLFAGSVAHAVVAGSNRPVVVCRPTEAG